MNRYYKINRILLSMLHLWPYQRSKLANINHTIHFIIMLSFLFVQCTSFLTFQLTVDFFIMVLSYMVPSFIYIIQYYSFYSNPNAVKRIYKDICDSWGLLKDGAECDIMQQYSFAGKLYTKILLVGYIVGFNIYIFIELFPVILDIIFPLNETRPREIHAVTEYFIDQRIYFYPIICHWLLGVSFGGFVLIATLTLELVYVEHICGLLNIARFWDEKYDDAS